MVSSSADSCRRGWPSLTRLLAQDYRRFAEEDHIVLTIELPRHNGEDELVTIANLRSRLDRVASNVVD